MSVPAGPDGPMGQVGIAGKAAFSENLGKVIQPSEIDRFEELAKSIGEAWTFGIGDQNELKRIQSSLLELTGRIKSRH